MNAPDAGFLRMLEEQRAAYRAGLPDRIADIAARWDKVGQNAADRHGLEELLRAAHGLAGSGATFGLVEISTDAKVLEERLQSLLDGTRTADAEQCAHIGTAIALLATRASPARP